MAQEDSILEDDKTNPEESKNEREEGKERDDTKDVSRDVGEDVPMESENSDDV